MITFKIRRFLQNQYLNNHDKIYLTTKHCTCNACRTFNEGFEKDCPSDKLDYLKHINRV